jgi:hypothetical protein
MSGIAAVTDWTSGTAPKLTIGNPALAVHIWQFDHELWNARFRQPHLLLRAADPALSCTYDIMADTAAVTRSQ